MKLFARTALGALLALATIAGNPVGAWARVPPTDPAPVSVAPDGSTASPAPATDAGATGSATTTTTAATTITTTTTLPSDRTGLSGSAVVVDPVPTSTPSLTVTPDTDLADGTIVDFAGSGFPAGATVTVAQCPCFHGPGGGVIVDADAFGDIAGRLRVRRQLFVTGPVDCASASCFVVAQVDPPFGGPPLAQATDAITFDANAPASPPTPLVASPTSELHEATWVHVTGHGYQLNATIATLYQCVPGVGCDLDTGVPVTADDQGDVDAAIRVHRAITVDGVDRRCDAAPGACVLEAGVSTFPLTFALPEESVTATPTTGLVDGQAITVTASHFATDRYVLVQQCSAPDGLTEHCQSGPFVYDRTLDGGWSRVGQVARFLATPLGTVDCRAQTCYLVGEDVTFYERRWVLSLSFATEEVVPPTNGGTAAPVTAQPAAAVRGSGGTRSSTGTATLPVTGTDPRVLIGLALGAMATGAAATRAARRAARLRPRRLPVAGRRPPRPPDEA